MKVYVSADMEGVADGDQCRVGARGQNEGAPLLLGEVTGDQVVGPEAEPFRPGIQAVVVKESLIDTSDPLAAFRSLFAVIAITRTLGTA